MTLTDGVLCGIVCWLLVGLAITRTTQSTYEDHRQIQIALGPKPPMIWQPRGLATFSIWLQAHLSTSPVLFRAVNVALAGMVSVLVGIVAWRLGGSGWFAGGLMAVHPLTIETLAMISGRRELVAALFVLAAVVIVVWPRWSALVTISIVAWSLLLGLSGKESAIVGLGLVPLAALSVRRYHWRVTSMALLVGVLSLGALCWQSRHVGRIGDNEMSQVAWTGVQSTAAARLLTLSVLPRHQTIDFDYDAISPSLRYATVPMLALVPLFGISLWKTRRLASFGCLWIALVILPRLIVQTPTAYFNEHEWYLALAGVAFVFDGLLLPRAEAI